MIPVVMILNLIQNAQSIVGEKKLSFLLMMIRSQALVKDGLVDGD
jgi:hypothetical protein